jgi:hypothetical protein
MMNRTVTDEDDRMWVCTPEESGHAAGTEQGRDVVLSCTTESVTKPVRVTVGWQWAKMASKGLARMIALAAPLPGR